MGKHRHTYHWVWALSFILLLCGWFVLLMGLNQAFAHDTEVVACFNNGKSAQLKRTYVHQNGLFAELYLLKEGGVVLALSPITGYQYNWEKDGKDDLVVEHSEHPIAFFTDPETDGRFDEAFVDKGGEGKCAEIEHYRYFNETNDPNNPEREASEQWSLG